MYLATSFSPSRRVALSRQGGKRRAEVLSQEQRREIERNAGLARVAGATADGFGSTRQEGRQGSRKALIGQRVLARSAKPSLTCRESGQDLR
jgi:hypothetical protein